MEYQQKSPGIYFSVVAVTLEMVIDHFGEVLGEDAQCISVTTYRVFLNGTRVLSHQYRAINQFMSFGKDHDLYDSDSSLISFYQTQKMSVYIAGSQEATHLLDSSGIYDQLAITTDPCGSKNSNYHFAQWLIIITEPTFSLMVNVASEPLVEK